MRQRIRLDGALCPNVENFRRPRTKWFWRLLFVNVWLCALLLIAGLFGASTILLVTAFEEGLSLAERIYTLGGGGLIFLVGLFIIRMALPQGRSTSGL